MHKNSLARQALRVLKGEREQARDKRTERKGKKKNAKAAYMLICLIFETNKTVITTHVFKFDIIDHFHYDVTRAKVSGRCSKDRAQCRAIAGKCQKISRNTMSAKASYQVFYKVMCSIAIQIQMKEIQRGVFCFFSISEELRRKNCEEEKLFSQILDTACVAGKCVLTMCQCNFPHEKKN